MPVSLPSPARLANLVRSGLLRRASGGAYGEWQAGLAEIGAWVTALGMARLVQVRVREMVTHAGRATWAMRWEVIGPGGLLFPALDAGITLTPAGTTPACSRSAALEEGILLLAAETLVVLGPARTTGLISRASWLMVRPVRRYSRYDRTVAVICFRASLLTAGAGPFAMIPAAGAGGAAGR